MELCPLSASEAISVIANLAKRRQSLEVRSYRLFPTTLCSTCVARIDDMSWVKNRFSRELVFDDSGDRDNLLHIRELSVVSHGDLH